MFLLIGKTYALDIKAQPITFIMRHRNAPSKCEECHVKEGITTGLSGDLLCQECIELQRRNATQQTNVKVKVTNTEKTTSSPSSEDTEESEQGKIVIFNALLTYATYAMQNSSYDTTKAAILGHFCAQDINNAKDSLWDNCGVSVIGEKPKRRDSSIRSEKEANVFDILTALNTLDKSGNLPTFAVTSSVLFKIPRFSPEETISPSVVDRVIALENKFCNMQSVVDWCLCENLELKDKLCEKTTYSSVITSQLNSAVKPSTVNSMDKSKQNHPTISTLVNSVGNRQNKHTGETNYVLSDPGPKTDYFKHDANHNLARTQSLLSLDHKSVVSVDSEGFRKPTYAMKKLRRNAKSVVGKSQPQGVFKGAPTPPKDLFVFHVAKDTEIGDLKQYIGDKGIECIDLQCMSHPDSVSKSFKLSVSDKHYKDLLSEEAWPTGVKVRRFIPPRRKNPDT